MFLKQYNHDDDDEDDNNSHGSIIDQLILSSGKLLRILSNFSFILPMILFIIMGINSAHTELQETEGTYYIRVDASINHNDKRKQVVGCCRS